MGFAILPLLAWATLFSMLQLEEQQAFICLMMFSAFCQACQGAWLVQWGGALPFYARCLACFPWPVWFSLHSHLERHIVVSPLHKWGNEGRTSDTNCSKSCTAISMIWTRTYYSIHCNTWGCLLLPAVFSGGPTSWQLKWGTRTRWQGCLGMAVPIALWISAFVPFLF